MRIEVIGSGCKKCKMLFDLTQEVAGELGAQGGVAYSTDITKILNMGLVSSPVVTIDGDPVVVGVLPSREKLTQIISERMSGTRG